jgi:hypothetical protein
MNMELSELMKQPLNADYLQGMVEKVLLTLDKYELIIPGIPDILQEMFETMPTDEEEEDYHGAIVAVLKVLGKYRSSSPFMIELTEGLKQDLCHAISKDFPKHEGEFYVSSVAD